MFRTLTAAILLAGAFSLPASAKMDCDAMFAEAQAALMSMKNLTAGQRASRSRIALQAYDLCSVGDEDSATKFFRMMMRDGA